jgi:murein DD-endopeptidase MepM/ murein hydrolase activator NlpD
MLRRALAVLLLLVTLASPAAAAPSAATSFPTSASFAATANDAVGEWPLQPVPEVVSLFDPPEVVWGAGHRGVDLAGHLGQPVRAALAGTVSYVGRVAGIAVVVVDHGSTRTTYQPVESSVLLGQPVAAGEVIGSLAWFGTHCMPAACLHWGWRRGMEYLDPLDLVGGGPRPVRLLPLDDAPSAASMVTLPRSASGMGRPGMPLL